MTKESYNPDLSGVNEEFRRAEAQKQAEEMKNKTRWQRFADFFKNGRTRFALGIILLLLGVYLLLSFMSFFLYSGMADQNQVAANGVLVNAQQPDQMSNWGAAVGASLSQFLIADGVGVAAFILVIWCVTMGLRLVRKGRKAHFFSYTLITLFSIFTCSMVVGAATYGMNITFFPLGGGFGHFANKWLYGLVGIYGMIAVNAIIIMLWVFACYKTLKALYDKAKSSIDERRRRFDGKEIDDEKDDVTRQQTTDLFGAGRATQTVKDAPPENPLTTVPANERQAAEDGKRRSAVTRRESTDKGKRQQERGQAGEPAVMNDIETAQRVSNPNDPTGEYRHYRFPTLDLLADMQMRTDSVDQEEQDSNKQRIRETLRNYGIEIKDIQVHVGPTVTLFEIVPVDGTRVSKVKNLEDDIALSLAALGIRIIAPMPGRGTIGIEVPNREPQTVPMRQVLASKAFQETKAKLPMCLGCTVSNEVFVADLTKMPHLLVAGATGKGKSVGLNAIITSLLYKKGPSELKFVLVDPKRVEFSIYADLEKYFFAKVPGDDKAIITESDKVVKTLNSLVQEMEDRYRVLEEVKLRKVEDYNDLWRRELREVRDEHGDKKYHYMPYIVAIIDEFSDMIMAAGKEVETPIVRIAQKARAVGIHMIIATQRPSATVITGNIRANFPGRIAFAVASSVDSRIILDATGAQRLIGRGDMLLSDDNGITRLQCPFVDTPDIIRISNFIKEQEDNDRDIAHEQCYLLPEYNSGDDTGGGSADASGIKDRDPLFEEAVKWIVQSDTASTSSLQRRYEIGYNRAGRLMDQMENAGVVGPAQGGKPRKVLLSPMDVDQLFG
ncbi:MAG: DNA translocase FtsK [Muribaculaceae bacterium]|nr:DNA translocase FtsK [Muribaculaceae bacterium]MBR1475948.1 DNA translocase FtsK [Muribaculaceae bacterium]